MPTDDQSTQGADASAHQPHTESQNAQAPSEPSFDARKAFDAVNRRLNQLDEKFKPEATTPRKDEKQVESTPDVTSVVQRELWKNQNADRIESVSEQYESYLGQGLKPDLALRLAEQDKGIQVDTTAQKRQQKVSASDASVDRDAPPAMPDSLKGIMTPEQFAKVAGKAGSVRIIR
jgi:hypothetical protein